MLTWVVNGAVVGVVTADLLSPSVSFMWEIVLFCFLGRRKLRTSL